MAKKYDIALNFAQMTPIKAYILGLMWADGWITSTETECALSSNDDEIYKLNELIYPKQNHSIEKRNSGCKIIHICNKQIVSQVTYSPTYASLRGGGFSLKYGNPHSIDELSPCVPRFLFLFYANAILIPSFRMFTAALISLL